MVVSKYSETFFGMPVADYKFGEKPADGEVVHRLVQEYESEQTQRELLDEYLGKVDPKRLRALVLGSWSEASTGTPPQEYLDGLIAHRLPNLAALYVGDMTFEDAEISWIVQGDYQPLLAAYPNLEVLRIRGGGIGLPTMKMPRLSELVIETGGLPHALVDAIAASDLPSLRRLELWLGDDNYGFDGDLSHYQNLLAKIRPERLDYLGLRNAQISDELASFIANQPWLATLPMLDLSMGTLSDVGAEALIKSPYIKGLGSLDVCHHYLSPAVVKKLKQLSLTLHIDEAEEADEGSRYVEVGE